MTRDEARQRLAEAMAERSYQEAQREALASAAQTALRQSMVEGGEPHMYPSAVSKWPVEWYYPQADAALDWLAAILADPDTGYRCAAAVGMALPDCYDEDGLNINRVVDVVLAAIIPKGEQPEERSDPPTCPRCGKHVESLARHPLMVDSEHGDFGSACGLVLGGRICIERLPAADRVETGEQP